MYMYYSVTHSTEAILWDLSDSLVSLTTMGRKEHSFSSEAKGSNWLMFKYIDRPFFLRTDELTLPLCAGIKATLQQELRILDTDPVASKAKHI